MGVASVGAEVDAWDLECVGPLDEFVPVVVSGFGHDGFGVGCFAADCDLYAEFSAAVAADAVVDAAVEE